MKPKYCTRCLEVSGIKFTRFTEIGDNYKCGNCSLRIPMRRNFGADLRVKLEGTKVGFWEIIEWMGHGNYRCKCACGKIDFIPGPTLLKKDSRSCGCKSRELREEAKLNKKKKEAPFRAEPKYE